MLLGTLAFFIPQTAQADFPRLRVIPQSDLRFGEFAVMDRGYRIVSPTGSVQSSGIFSTSNSGTGPARFTVQYDRGNNGRRRLDLKIELRFSATPVLTQGGVVTRLTQYQTDLPRYSTVNAGQVIEIDLPNCVQRVCQTTFNLGGRLDVERSYGGGSVALGIPVDAVLISVK